MNAPFNPSTFSSTSSTTSPLSLLARQLEGAQRLEDVLWSATTAGGTDKLWIAGAADDAWMQVRASAAAIVATPATGWLGREKRLVAGLLLTLLDAGEPDAVARLQAMARTISEDERVGTQDEVRHLLHLIARGPFVLSPVGFRWPAPDGRGDEDLVPIFAA